MPSAALYWLKMLVMDLHLPEGRLRCSLVFSSLVAVSSLAATEKELTDYCSNSAAETIKSTTATL